jgi:hypothetical protein
MHTCPKAKLPNPQLSCAICRYTYWAYQLQLLIPLDQLNDIAKLIQKRARKITK